MNRRSFLKPRAKPTTDIGYESRLMLLPNAYAKTGCVMGLMPVIHDGNVVGFGYYHK
jgi:hypothetical protein